MDVVCVAFYDFVLCFDGGTDGLEDFRGCSHAQGVCGCLVELLCELAVERVSLVEWFCEGFLEHLVELFDGQEDDVLGDKVGRGCSVCEPRLLCVPPEDEFVVDHIDEAVHPVDVFDGCDGSEPRCELCDLHMLFYVFRILFVDLFHGVVFVLVHPACGLYDLHGCGEGLDVFYDSGVLEPVWDVFWFGCGCEYERSEGVSYVVFRALVLFVVCEFCKGGLSHAHVECDELGVEKPCDGGCGFHEGEQGAFVEASKEVYVLVVFTELDMFDDVLVCQVCDFLECICEHNPLLDSPFAVVAGEHGVVKVVSVDKGLVVGIDAVQGIGLVMPFDFAHGEPHKRIADGSEDSVRVEPGEGWGALVEVGEGDAVDHECVEEHVERDFYGQGGCVGVPQGREVGKGRGEERSADKGADVTEWGRVEGHSLDEGERPVCDDL